MLTGNLLQTPQPTAALYYYHQSFLPIEAFSFLLAMVSDPRGVAVVLMGVSGSGKSTIGQALAQEATCSFLDADDYHPLANKDKMKRGIPLTEEDRLPWLKTLRDALKDKVVAGENVVLGCSALQTKYREILRSADTNYGAMKKYVSRVKFVHLNAPAELLAARMESRAKEGRHFMPASLLQSQIDLLQIDNSEGIVTVDATLPPRSVVAAIRDRIPL